MKKPMNYYRITNKETGEIQVIAGLSQRDAVRAGGWTGAEIAKLQVEPKAPNARVIDRVQGWDDEYVETIPQGARVFDFEGTPLYYLIRNYDKSDNNPELKPYERPDKVDVPPEKAYRATRWGEVKLLFKHKPSMMEKINTAGTIGLVALFALIILIFVSQ